MAKGVVVTRPAHQAEHLCRLLEEAGFRPIRFPTVAIADPKDRAPLMDLLGRLEDFDLAIFISANAVHRALAFLHRPWPEKLPIAAIGKASAKALAQHGLPVAVRPPRRFDSEGLLEVLRDVAGKRIVIFRGEGGRELLADALRARGADVAYAEVYRRVRPTQGAEGLLKLWARGEIQAVVVTSNEILQNLWEMVGKLGQQWLRQTLLVTLSERTAGLAQRLGCRHIAVAEEASDEAIVRALRSPYR